MSARPHLVIQDPALWLFISMGFLAGIYIAGMEVGTLTLFLNELDESRYLALAFLLIAVVSIMTINLFNRLQRSVSYYRLSWGVLLLLAVCTLVLRLLFAWADTPVQRSRLVFGSFVVASVLIVFVNLVFWGTIYHYYNLKQQKRLIGNIDVGKSIAGVAAFLAIPLFSRYFPQTEDLIDIGAVMSWAIVGLYSVFLWFKRKQKNEATPSGMAQQHWGIGHIFRHRYTRYMVIFVFLSVISFQLVDYTFLTSAAVLYPLEKDLQNFIALFEGSTLLLAFLLQSFVTDRLIEQYGVGIALLIAPVLLLTLLAIGLAVEGFAPDWHQQSNTFLLFFMALALTRMTLAALKESNEDTAFKFCYFPIPREARLSVLHQIDGNIRTGAGIVAGLLLLIFQYWQLSNLLLLTAGILVLGVLWLGSVWRLSGAYRSQLHRLLHTGPKESQNTEAGKPLPYRLPSYDLIEDLCRHKSSYNKQWEGIFLRITPQIAAPCFNNPDIDGMQDAKAQALLRMLLESHPVEDALLPAIIESMGTPHHTHLAAALLCRMGERVLPVLESYFIKAGHNDFLLNHILETYARIGTHNAWQLLYKHLHSTSPAVHRQAFKLIMAMNNPLRQDLQEYVYRLIDIELTDALWDMMALEVLPDIPAAAPLRHALRAEIKENYDNIFTALHALYDSSSVRAIRHNIEAEDTESQVLAVELLSTLLNEHLKERLVPFFEDIPTDKKLNRLSEYYPVEKMPSQKVLETLVIRDYAYTTPWTRACALRFMTQTDKKTDIKPLIANVFHPNRLIRESSFYALHIFAREQAEAVLERLPLAYRQALEQLVQQQLPPLVDCGRFLYQSDLFRGISEEIMQDIILHCERYRTSQGTIELPRPGIWAIYREVPPANNELDTSYLFSFFPQKQALRLQEASTLLYLPPSIIEYHAAYSPELLNNYLAFMAKAHESTPLISLKND